MLRSKEKGVPGNAFQNLFVHTDDRRLIGVFKRWTVLKNFIILVLCPPHHSKNKW